MKINFLEDDSIIAINENNNKFKIVKERINGTMIYNYFVYGCYGIDDYDYFVNEYATLEDALKDCEKGFY